MEIVWYKRTLPSTKWLDAACFWQVFCVVFQAVCLIRVRKSHRQAREDSPCGILGAGTNNVSACLVSEIARARDVVRRLGALVPGLSVSCCLLLPWQVRIIAILSHCLCDFVQIFETPIPLMRRAAHSRHSRVPFGNAPTILRFASSARSLQLAPTC